MSSNPDLTNIPAELQFRIIRFALGVSPGTGLEHPGREIDLTALSNLQRTSKPLRLSVSQAIPGLSYVFHHITQTVQQNKSTTKAHSTAAYHLSAGSRLEKPGKTTVYVRDCHCPGSREDDPTLACVPLDSHSVLAGRSGVNQIAIDYTIPDSMDANPNAVWVRSKDDKRGQPRPQSHPFLRCRLQSQAAISLFRNSQGRPLWYMCRSPAGGVTGPQEDEGDTNGVTASLGCEDGQETTRGEGETDVFVQLGSGSGRKTAEEQGEIITIGVQSMDDDTKINLDSAILAALIDPEEGRHVGRLVQNGNTVMLVDLSEEVRGYGTVDGYIWEITDGLQSLYKDGDLLLYNDDHVTSDQAQTIISDHVRDRVKCLHKDHFAKSSQYPMLRSLILGNGSTVYTRWMAKLAQDTTRE